MLQYKFVVNIFCIHLKIQVNCHHNTKFMMMKVLGLFLFYSIIDCTIAFTYLCKDVDGDFKLKALSGSTKWRSCSWARNNIARCNHPGVKKNCSRSCNNCPLRTFTADVMSRRTSTCLDSESSFEVSSVGSVTCKGWTESSAYKCQFSAFVTNCPRTCGQCCDDFSSTERFEVTTINLSSPYKLCGWVLKKHTLYRCSFEEVKYHCPGSCDICATPSPSLVLSDTPSINPTDLPTSSKPSSEPTRPPSPAPSPFPTARPSNSPSESPSDSPSVHLSDYPSLRPSINPTDEPTSVPSLEPTSKPSSQPSLMPSSKPSQHPSSLPTSIPSSTPSLKPSQSPSSKPSSKPSSEPSSKPSLNPSSEPSTKPSLLPSSQPSAKPTTTPSLQPSSNPSSEPSLIPSSNPSSKPSLQPSSQPSSKPSLQPSSNPSAQPSFTPSDATSAAPSECEDESGWTVFDPSGKLILNQMLF